ncbi:virulence associated lipoprotein [Borreliella lusitaniae]|uniref:Virulence associated lipoprotein n=1 Tax=Borreliella lusitaniae TaxID=100177 RepID=A0ABZ0CIQ9_9SPIR|nr:virulence associated lipoprotein [Borreliella lusitaniae]WNY69110.1 virulence associated lipoprotein [Borreliella lusitaniae]
MKYSIIASIFVFLFLNACNPDVNINQKKIKHQSSKKRTKYNKKKLTPKAEVKPNQEVTPKAEAKPNQEEDHNKKIKNTPLDDLINLIKKANAEREEYVKRFDKEPEDQYGMLVFKEFGWVDKKDGEKLAANTERSNRYRKNVYSALYTIDTNQLKTVSEIIIKAGKTQGTLNTISLHEGKIADTIVDLYSKKDTLNKLEISDIEKLTNSFKKILSIKKDVSDAVNQLLLDYKNDKNNIKTNTDELKSSLTALQKQLREKETETDKLKEEISSLMNKP